MLQHTFGFKVLLHRVRLTLTDRGVGWRGFGDAAHTYTDRGGHDAAGIGGGGLTHYIA